MANEKQRKTSPLVVVAFILALVAFTLSAITLSRFYNVRNGLREVQEKLQKKEEVSQEESDKRFFNLEAIGKKISEAKESIFKKDGNKIAMDKLSEAKNMMKEYKERLTPTLKEKWESLMEQTEEVAEGVKNRATDAGEKLDSLAKSIERFLDKKDESDEEPVEEGDSNTTSDWEEKKE